MSYDGTMNKKEGPFDEIIKGIEKVGENLKIINSVVIKIQVWEDDVLIDSSEAVLFERAIEKIKDMEARYMDRLHNPHHEDQEHNESEEIDEFKQESKAENDQETILGL